MKLRIEKSNCFYYPDVMVSCEPYEAKSVYKKSPVLICEILSPSTAEIDRREKLAAYKQLPQWQDYLVVHQDERTVEHYFRSAARNWTLKIAHGDDVVAMTSLANSQLKISLNDIYEEVML